MLNLDFSFYYLMQERLTLKHKNKSKWARRILERGLNVQDEGTRAAMAQQLHDHALLTRKINTVKDSSSSSSSDSGSDDDDDGSDQDRASDSIAKAKEKTLKVLEDDEEVPDSGVLSLPFMVNVVAFFSWTVKDSPISCICSFFS